VDSYISGIVCGILEGAGFPARVTAHSVILDDSETSQTVSTTNTNLPPRREKAVFLVKFTPEVLERDASMA